MGEGGRASGPRSSEPWALDTPLEVGFHPPEQCARGRRDCRSLAQIIASEGDQSFMCVGERDPATMTGERLDRWRFCHRGDRSRDYQPPGDVMVNVCRYDMSHMAAVLSMGLAVVMPVDGDPGPVDGDKSREGPNSPRPMEGEG